VCNTVRILALLAGTNNLSACTSTAGDGRSLVGFRTVHCCDGCVTIPSLHPTAQTSQLPSPQVVQSPAPCPDFVSGLCLTRWLARWSSCT